MNKAKTLKRKIGNSEPFLSVAWNTDNIPSQVSVNQGLKWTDIDWTMVEKNVFKLQKLITEHPVVAKSVICTNTKDF